MSSFDTALSRGYGVCYMLQIEGIPYTFSEARPSRYDSYNDVANATSGGVTYTNTDSLVMSDTQLISQDIDRTSGITGGRSVDFLLNYDAMGSVTQALFKKPTAQAEITSDVAHGATTVVVDNLGAFAGSGAIYIGKEYIRYGGTASTTTFNGLTRGEINQKYTFKSTSFSSYRFVTDVPMVWRGRQVTLWEHLVTPDGYIIPSQWMNGTYAREIWKGYIDEMPAPDPLGMRLRCLPIQRLLSKKIGYNTKFDVYNHGPFGGGAYKYASAVVASRPGDKIQIGALYNDGNPSTAALLSSYFELDLYAETGSSADVVLMQRTTHNGMLHKALLDSGGFESLNWVGDLKIVDFDVLGETIYFTQVANYEVTEGYFMVSEDGPEAYAPGKYKINEWLTEPKLGNIGGVNYLIPGEIGYQVFIPYRVAGQHNKTIAVHNMEGSGWQDTELATSGLAILTVDDSKEIVRFKKESSTDSIALPNDEIIILTLTERGIGNTSILNVVDGDDVTFELGAGWHGDLKNVALTLLESSGTALRGSYDTLPLGFGYGIDDGNIDETSFSSPDLIHAEMEATCISEGSDSWDEMMGGWFSAQGRAIASIKNSSDNVVLKTVDWVVTADPDATTISKTDVVLKNVTSPKMIEGPNSVSIKTASIGEKSPEVVVRDIPRIQSEGPRNQTLNLPSATSHFAGQIGASYVYFSDGLTAMTLRVGPHITLQVGDNCILSLAHPAMYDWSAGTNMPASVFGKVMRTEKSLSARWTDLTILMSSNILETLYLCPSAVVASGGSGTSEIVLTTGHGAYLKPSDKIYVYKKGDESSNSAEYTIAGGYTAGSDTVTITGTFASFVAAGSIVTFPVYGNATTYQKTYAYVHYDKRWTG